MPKIEKIEGECWSLFALIKYNETPFIKGASKLTVTGSVLLNQFMIPD